MKFSKFKRPLILVMMLAIALSAVTGGTIAWFTDSVTSEQNIIQAGNLDIELYHTNTQVTDEKVDETTGLFPIPALWEPGVVAWENLKVVNEGNLPLKYEMVLNAITENNLNGSSLSQVLKIAIVEGGVNAAAREALIGGIAEDEWKTLADFKVNGTLTAEEPGSTAVYGVVIYWQPGASDNNWNVNNGQQVSDYAETNNNYLYINLGVKLTATQLNAPGMESDDDTETEFSFPIQWNTIEANQNVTESTSFEYSYTNYVKLADFTPSATRFTNSDCTFSTIENGETLNGYLSCEEITKYEGFTYINYDGVMKCIIIETAGVYEELGGKYLEAGFYVMDLGADGIDADFVIDSDYTGNIDENFDMSNVKPTLADNDWETIQKVIQAGRVIDAGWKVGDTSPEFSCNGVTVTARIIGIDQDGSNTVTFMLEENIGIYPMNKYDKSNRADNTGGFAASDANIWLNETIYNSLDKDVQSVIKPVTKKNTSDDTNPTAITSASYKLFLLSVKEVGLADELENKGSYAGYMDTIDAESDFIYSYFKSNDMSKRAELSNNRHWWLRTTYSKDNYCFFKCDSVGMIDHYNAYIDYSIIPAFVVG